VSNESRTIMSAHRVVTLLASATEIVDALGCGDRLVGRSHECDFPASVGRLPVCTAPKFRVEGSSKEIDQRLRTIVQEALSVYRVDGDLLRELAPDVIVTQSQCEVCAVSDRDLEEAIRAWVDSRPRVVTLEPNGLAEVWGDVARIADALQVPDRGADLVTRLRGRMDAVGAAVDGARRPTVACIDWIEPLMAAANWMPELVTMAGGENQFGDAGKHAQWIEFADLAVADPDVIVVMPCGFDLPRTVEEMPALSDRPDWPDLKAVRTGRVYLADGNQYFNRSGPRLVESLEMLAEMLHPGQVGFGHEGTGWVRA
jgi:iron complex transport system substrate-binding protein